MKKIIIDSHCDTALKIYKKNNINSINNQFTLKNSLKYDKYIQFFAMYIEPDYVKNSEYELCVRLINAVKNEAYKNSKHIKIIKSKKDLNKYFKSKTKSLGMILTIEDGVCLEGNINNLQKFYDMGVRVIGLTWNGKNQIASGVNCESEKDSGLSNFGVAVVSRMNELGMIIDVSHLSEKSFYDVMKVTGRPVMASHSCAKTICNHKRNLSDDQIKVISESGGIIGVNFYNEFLDKNTSNADIECLVKHIRHIYDIGGKKCVGLGSDYDGIKKENIVTGLEDNSKLTKLYEYLKNASFSDEDIDAIMWKNHYDFIRSQLN